MLASCALMLLAQGSPKLTPGEHVIPADGQRPAVAYTGSDFNLDLSKVRLVGDPSPEQEHYEGVGILLDHCRNVTITGLRVRGYRIGLLLRDCQNVRIERVDAGNSHAERILSDSGQPIDKFLTLRDIREWRSYGAGIWLQNCSQCRVEHCTSNDAMTGAVLESCKSCTVYDNQFSYNSAWGLALWQTSESHIMWNHLDFCNRPWSGGWGGDTAGMALVASSNHNIIAGNSMTHGGDGFFLSSVGLVSPADEEPVTGPCNRNYVWRNDGSWSTNNAFEATFSAENAFGEDIANDSGYGFWLGYSNNSLVAGNQIFRDTHDGVAVEHGQFNRIQANHISGAGERGIHLWTEPNAPVTEPASTDNTIEFNHLDTCGQGINLDNSRNTVLVKNPADNAPIDPAILQQTAPTGVPRSWAPPAEVQEALQTRPKGWKFYRDQNAPKGFQWIRCGTYAPMHARTIASAWTDSYTFEIWTSFIPQNVTAPDWVTVAPMADHHYWTAQSKPPETAPEEDVGQTRHATITLSGVLSGSERGRTAERTVAHTLHLPFRTGAWDCKWFTWKGLTYADRQGWTSLFSGAPTAEEKRSDLDSDFSYRSPVPGKVPVDHFALLATRKYKFEGGIYSFTSLSDDGIRLFLDDREIFSRWTHHSATPDQAQVTITPGVHAVRVEYFQEDGAAVLQVDWKRVRTLATLTRS